MEITYHYPPELLNLLTDVIPLLCRSKRDVITFFKGAGVSAPITNDLVKKINFDKSLISKYEIANTVLIRLNQKGEPCLRERREVLKRVVEFENFSSCWPSDQLKAKGLVSEVRDLVNVKDSFTRMSLERDQEQKKRREEQQSKLKAAEARQKKLQSVKSELFNLFSEPNPHRRGKALEKVLNQLFEIDGLLLKEAFTISDANGVSEQIDGVIEIDSQPYLVEMKWWAEDLGPGEVSQHLVRVFSRGHARGIFLSNSGYTPAAVTVCREALQRSVVVLGKLDEIVFVLEREIDLRAFFKSKIDAAIIHKNPLYLPCGTEFF